MPLLEITQTKKQKIMGVEVSNTTTRIEYSPNSNLGFAPKPNIVSQSVRVLKYVYEHPVISPHLYTNSEGKKFIIPTWQEVHPQTTLEDIDWVKPEVNKVPEEKNTWKFESSSDPGHFYTVRQSGLKLSCNCSGFWRAKDRNKGCKHCQEVRKQLNK